MAALYGYELLSVDISNAFLQGARLADAETARVAGLESAKKLEGLTGQALADAVSKLPEKPNADAFATATVVGAIEGVCRDMLKSADVVPNLLLLFPLAPAATIPARKEE